MRIDKKTKVKITDPLEMVGFIRTNGTKCQFVSLLTRTVPKLKKSCPYTNVIKIARRSGLMNVNYNTAVRRLVSKALGIELSDVEYENGETWYRHELTVDDKALPLCTHKTKKDGKFYLQFYPTRNSPSKYVSGITGEEIPYSALKPHFYARKDLDFKPRVVVFSMENVVQLNAANVIIKTDETDQVAQVLAK